MWSLSAGRSWTTLFLGPGYVTCLARSLPYRKGCIQHTLYIVWQRAGRFKVHSAWVMIETAGMGPQQFGLFLFKINQSTSCRSCC